MALQQGDDSEGQEARHEGAALLPGVAALLDRAHDRLVGRRPTDTELLQALDERRLGVASWWLGVVPSGDDVTKVGGIALLEGGQPFLLGVVVLVALVGALHVDLQEPLVGDHRARGGEQRLPTGLALDPETERHGLAGGVGHLRRDGPSPDQLVDLQVLGAQLRRDLVWRSEPVAGGTDRLVRLLGVLDLLLVGARRFGYVLLSESLGDLRASGGHRRVGQRRRVGAHVGDEPTLVQALGDPHRLRRGQAELTARLLLIGRRDEGRRRSTAVRLRLAAPHGCRPILEVGDERSGHDLVEVHDVALRQRSALGEVPAGGDAGPVELEEHRGEGPLGPRGERAGQIPIVGGTECHPLPLPLDDDPRGDALHPASRQPRLHLLPEDR